MPQCSLLTTHPLRTSPPEAFISSLAPLKCRQVHASTDKLQHQAWITAPRAPSSTTNGVYVLSTSSSIKFDLHRLISIVSALSSHPHYPLTLTSPLTTTPLTGSEQYQKTPIATLHTHHQSPPPYLTTNPTTARAPNSRYSAP